MKKTPSTQSVVVPVDVLNEAAGVLDCEGYGPLSVSLLSCLSAPAPSSLAGGEERFYRRAAKIIRELGPSMSPGALAATCERRADKEAAAAPPEAPVREGVDLNAIAKDAAERVHKNGGCVPQMAYAPILFALQDALTPRHEAPDRNPLDPDAPSEAMIDAGLKVDWSNEDERGTVINVWYAMNAARRHEAPADGAGERDRIIAFLKERDEACGTVDADDDERAESADMILALRARSSAPEAREGEAVAWQHRFYSHEGQPGPWAECAPPEDPNNLRPARIIEYRPLYTHPAAPSADKLRIAVEALELTKGRIQTWPIDDQETCMCGSPVAGHGMGDGHSPVSQGDHAVSMLVEEIDQALAALKAEAA